VIITFTIGNWKAKLPELLTNIQEKALAWGVDSVFGVCLALTLWPALEAMRYGDPAALVAVAAAVGTDLIVDHLKTLKSKPKEELPGDLAVMLDQNQERNVALNLASANFRSYRVTNL
jgi:hypothetical protein